MQMYEIGGCVRDEILGIKSKDIDFSVVMESSDFPAEGTVISTPAPYDVMVANLEDMGVTIFRDNDGVPIGAEHFTVRGRAPANFPNHPNRALDFVLARKDGEYSDGRRPDSVEVGTLEDDILRRDFTMNALAKDMDGNIIDIVGGEADINDRVIRAVGNAYDRLEEDALRAVRAVRFAVTKGFRIDKELEFAMQSFGVLENIERKIADERIQDEVSKMFRFDTVASMGIFNKYPALMRAVFSGDVSLDATMKTKGRGGQFGRQKTPKYRAARNGCTCRCHTDGGMHIVACCR